MSLSAALLPEFDQEVSSLRKCLERLPEGKLNWKPHAKSMSLGALATHLANLLTWVNRTLEVSEFDLAPDGEPMKAVELHTRAELLAALDANAAKARKALAGASDECLNGPWTLMAAGKKFFTLPRTTCLRSFVLSHLVHHRGQLSVYLRMLDVPLLAIYGPSADDAGMLG
ncbi:MAG: DinB family protein [Planctomycetes bacterium]|nr:DinB family protein [Planctomycetota bacterium]